METMPVILKLVTENELIRKVVRPSVCLPWDYCCSLWHLGTSLSAACIINKADDSLYPQGSPPWGVLHCVVCLVSERIV